MLKLLFFFFAANLSTTAESYHIILDPKERTEIDARVSSPVTEVNYKMGDHFKQGDVLILLEKNVLEANYIKARSAFEKAKTKYEVKKALYDDGSATELEVYEAKAEKAEAYSATVTAKDLLDAAKVEGPYHGKVVSVYVDVHEIPKIGDPLIEVIDDSVLKAKFLVDSDTPIAIGDTLSIQIKETGEMIEATVTRLSPDIDPSSQTVKVEAEIDNSDEKLKSGMSGEVFLKGTNGEGS